MELPILKESGVVFNEGTHQYFLDGKELQGITSTLVHRIFPHDYDNVSQEKLNERAEYGHKVHDMLEFCILNGLDSDMAEWQMFKAIVAEQSLQVVRCEYIVTDFEHYASPIDVVMMNADGGVVLIDIKTNYAPPVEKATVQLSWYKRHFERMNPELKVVGCAVIWVRDDAKRGHLSGYYPITPWADEALDLLIDSDLKDLPFDIQQTYGTLPARVYDVQQYLADLEAEVKAKTEELKQIKDGLCQIMLEKGIKKFTTDVLQMTTVTPKPRETFDSKAFAADHPDLYKQYVKTGEVRPSVRITYK